MAARQRHHQWRIVLCLGIRGRTANAGVVKGGGYAISHVTPRSGGGIKFSSCSSGTIVVDLVVVAVSSFSHRVQRHYPCLLPLRSFDLPQRISNLDRSHYHLNNATTNASPSVIALMPVLLGGYNGTTDAGDVSETDALSFFAAVNI